MEDRDLQEVVELQTRRDGATLVERLTAERPEVRARAAFALGSVQDSLAVPYLMAALGDESPAVRRDAAFALGQAGAPAAVGALQAAFAVEANGPARRKMLEALSSIPSPESAVALLEAQPLPHEEVHRTMALARLGAVGGVATPEGQNLLLVRLDDGDPEVRAAAAYYFGRLPVAAPWGPSAPRVRQALDGYGKGDPAAMYLLLALGKLAEPQDGARLRAWLTDANDWRIRVNAAAALALLPPDSTSRAELIEALDDPSVLVADQAAQALARGTALPSELAPVEEWIQGHPDRLPAVGAMIGMLARADEDVFVFAWVDGLPRDDDMRWSVGLPAVGYLTSPDAMARLLDAVQSSNPQARGGAVAALADRWVRDRSVEGNHPVYFDVFSTAVRSGDVRAARWAATALADSAFLSLGSVSVLMDALSGMSSPQDQGAMVAVLDALASVGSPAALPVAQPAVRDSAPAAPPSAPALDWAYLAELGSAPRWTLETEKGTLVVQLAPEEAPLTVQTLARLTRDGKFDGVTFHRVVPNFVAQGGDFTSGDGSGGPGFTITSEFTEIPYMRGSAGMASAGKDTEGSQFFFTHSMQPHLNGHYTNFGWIVSGMAVVDLLDVGDRILRATIER